MIIMLYWATRMLKQLLGPLEVSYLFFFHTITSSPTNTAWIIHVPCTTWHFDGGVKSLLFNSVCSSGLLMHNWWRAALQYTLQNMGYLECGDSITWLISCENLTTLLTHEGAEWGVIYEFKNFSVIYLHIILVVSCHYFGMIEYKL